MKKTAVALRPMELSDITAAMKLSTAEGWNQTENDWRLLIENHENVCLIAESDKKVIGTTTVMNYSQQVAWIGMVLVDRQYRGLGVAKSLLAAILNKLERFVLVKLDATPAGQQVYKKFGFEDEYSIVRMTNSSFPGLRINEDKVIAEPIQIKDIGGIVALDSAVFGTSRQPLIEFLIKQYPGKSWLLKRNNKIAGFALGREGNKYHHVGPVVAETTADAEILISNALSSLANQPVVIDVLLDKKETINWLNRIGFMQQRQFIRMYKGENRFAGTTENLFSICGPEFG